MLELVPPYKSGEDAPMDETAWVVRRAIRGVNDADDEGRTGEEVGMKRGVELRCAGDEGAPRWDDIEKRKRRTRKTLESALDAFN